MAGVGMKVVVLEQAGKARRAAPADRWLDSSKLIGMIPRINTIETYFHYKKPLG
jgi:hypothetical protein